MDLKALLPLIVSGSMMAIVLGVGLQSRWADVVDVLRKPALVLRGLLAVNVVVPLVAVLVVWALPIAPLVKAGIVIMAVSPLAPFAPGKMLKVGAERSYVIGLYVALILAAVIVVPATAALLSATFAADVTIPVSALASLIVTSILIPLSVGVLVGTLWPEFGARAAPIVTVAGYVALLPIAGLFLYMAGGQLLALLGNGTLLAIVVTIVAGLAAGHWLGGPEPTHRMALAQAAAMRHPGIAGLIAHRHFDDQRVMLAVILFLLVGMLVCGIYQGWARKHLLPERPVQAARSAT